jgi:hypothetical protein
MIRWKRDLTRLDGVVAVEPTSGGHLRLVLANGKFVIAAFSPGTKRAMDNVRCHIARELGRPSKQLAVEPPRRRHRRARVRSIFKHSINRDRPPTPVVGGWKDQLAALIRGDL